MSSSSFFNAIGYYQFNNLVENRVPFLFLNFSEDISQWYTSIYKLHIETYQVLLNEDQLMKELTERQIPLEFALLLLCPNGELSERLARQLEIKGYSNVYIIQGGLEKMKLDKSTGSF